MKKSTIIFYFLFVIFLTAYSCWDYVIKVFGGKLVGYQDAVNGEYYSPDKNYYIEIWDTAKFTTRVLNMQEPGFVRVFDAKTKKKIIESQIFDVGPSIEIFWPCDEKDNYLMVGNELITKLPAMKNCYKSPTTR
jgi:hypothetical protein